MNRPRRPIPVPSDAALIRLASIVFQADDPLAPDNPLGKGRVEIRTVKNDRRRTMEKMLVLLADPEVRSYLAELKGLGLLPD